MTNKKEAVTTGTVEYDASTMQLVDEVERLVEATNHGNKLRAHRRFGPLTLFRIGSGDGSLCIVRESWMQDVIDDLGYSTLEWVLIDGKEMASAINTLSGPAFYKEELPAELLESKACPFPDDPRCEMEEPF